MENSENTIKFHLTITSIYQAIIWMLFLFVIAYASKWLSNLYFVVALPSCLLLLRLAISKLSPKKITMRDGQLIFKDGPFKYKLNPDKMRICYEKVSVWGGNFRDYYGLVLYRDANKIIGFHFNNEFVLIYEMDEIKLAYYKKVFQSKFEIEIHSVDNLL